MEESGIAELEVTEGEEKVRITRVQAGAAMAYPAMTQVALPQAAALAAAHAAAPAEAAKPARRMP